MGCVCVLSLRSPTTDAQVLQLGQRGSGRGEDLLTRITTVCVRVYVFFLLASLTNSFYIEVAIKANHPLQPRLVNTLPLAVCVSACVLVPVCMLYMHSHMCVLEFRKLLMCFNMSDCMEMYGCQAFPQKQVETVHTLKGSRSILYCCIKQRGRRRSVDP